MITIIAACDEAGGIGFQNDLPWPRNDRDMKRFQRITSGYPIIMGRKTFKSIGKPLPRRENIVVSRNNINHDGDFTVTDQLDELFLWYKHKLDAFVIGGASIYEQALPHATRILLTRITGTFQADTFWKPDLTGWMLVQRENDPTCIFEEYVRE